MAWENVFDLGQCEVYWVARNGTLRALEELSSGTIEVVDGVIQVRGVEPGFSSDDFIGVAVVPKYATEGLAARASIPNLSVDDPPFANPEIRLLLFNGPEDIALAQLEPVFNEPPDSIIGVDPDTEVEIGTMQGAVGDAHMRFTALDLGS